MNGKTKKKKGGGEVFGVIYGVPLLNTNKYVVHHRVSIMSNDNSSLEQCLHRSFDFFLIFFNWVVLVLNCKC